MDAKYTSYSVCKGDWAISIEGDSPRMPSVQREDYLTATRRPRQRQHLQCVKRFAKAQINRGYRVHRKNSASSKLELSNWHQRGYGRL